MADNLIAPQSSYGLTKEAGAVHRLVTYLIPGGLCPGVPAMLGPDRAHQLPGHPADCGEGGIRGKGQPMRMAG